MILEILQYATSSFWTFVGCAILIGTVTQGAVALAAVLIRGFRP